MNQSSLFGFHALSSHTQREPFATQRDHALGVDYLYNTRNLDLHLGAQDLSPNFQTESGYVTRIGISRVRASAVQKFYPKNSFVTRIDATLHSIQTRDKTSELYETDNGLSTRTIVWRRSSLILGYNYATEIFTDRFAAHKYRVGGYRVAWNSLVNNQITLGLNYRRNRAIFYADSSYQGYGNSFVSSLTYQPSEKINAFFSATYSDFFRESDEQKEFDILILRGRLTYQINKYLFFRGIVEHNDLRKRLLTDFLASFTYIPGTVLHFGYGSLYEKLNLSDDFNETRRGFFAKASYLWRL